ncbi:UDP glycosyltransferase [Mycetocola zhadangensis]|uniref:UDP glycosyltransferase n=2 Tax=Mycetocola zhadangensis TaxID=1164595 RepID=A0A3L7J839_9MICO|nr:UDP glycosyltransferase [Mycetocola zhadangensis]
MVGTTAPSHIYPSLALIRELVNRGHRVTYTVGEQLVDLVTPTGAEVIAHPSILPLDDTEWPDDPGGAMRVFLDEGIAVMPILTERYDTDPPDVVLYDIGGLPAPLLAARYSVPAVQLSPTYVAWDGYETDFADFINALQASASGIAYYETYNAWLRKNNIQTDATVWQTRPAHGLVLIPRAMQPNAEKVADNIQFVGPCLDPERLADTSWQPPASGAKVLLVSFGTAFNDQAPVYRACIEAFGDSGWHVVMAIGQHVDPAELGDLPDNVEVHKTVPQLAVLAHASAFITHAGMGGCTEALWFGVPTVAIPQAVDQFGNAAMLESLGVGTHLPADEVSAATLRESVNRVASSPDVAARLTEISAEVRANGGVGKAADAVEAFLS